MLWKRPDMNKKCSQMLDAIVERQVELELLFEDDAKTIPSPLELAKLLRSLGTLGQIATDIAEELDGLVNYHRHKAGGLQLG